MSSIDPNNIYIKVLESLRDSNPEKTHTLLLNFGSVMKQKDIIHIRNKIQDGDFNLTDLQIEGFELIHTLEKLLHFKKTRNQRRLLAGGGCIPVRNVPICDVMYNVCYHIHAQFKNAVLTGSAPLAQYFHYLRRNQEVPSHLSRVSKSAVENSDVDLFLHPHPQRLQLYQESYSTLPVDRWKELPSLISDTVLEEESLHIHPKGESPDKWYHDDLSYVAKILKNRFGIEMIIHEMVDFSTGVDPWDYNDKHVQRGHEYGALHLVLLRGITRIYNIQVKTPKGRIITRELQIIMVDAYPRPGQSWSDFITSSFDVNIATGVARTDNPALLCRLNFHPKALDSIRFGRFEFKIRNMVPFFEVYKRMVKYRRKGFHLKKITIHEDCTPWYREYIMRHFRFILGRDHAVSMFLKHAISDSEAIQIVDKHVMKFLDPVRSLEVESLRFEKQLNKVLMQVVHQNGYRTPGMRNLKKDVTFRWYSYNLRPFDVKSWLSLNLEVKGATCIQRWSRRYLINQPHRKGNILRRHYSARRIQRFWISKLGL